MKKKVIYYSDLLNDEFSGTNINAVELGEDFVFINKNPIWRFFAFILYYFFAFPLVALFCFFYLHLRVKNKNVLREFRRKGFFLYGNHTGFYDAFVHSVINFPKKSYVIANRDATSIRGLRQIVIFRE
jgi:preprotein translocase subunit SecY